MAVYERRYRPYEGALTAESSRSIVLTRYAMHDAFRSRLFVGFYALCFVAPLLAAFTIYLKYNTDILPVVGPLAELLALDRLAYRSFLSTQSFMAVIVAIVVCPHLLCRDFAGGALPLYLSRPITRLDYVVGKLAVPVLLLSLITWIPGLLLFGLQALLADSGWALENLRIFWALLAGSWAWILVLSLLGAAIAASVTSIAWARINFVVIFFVLDGLGAALMVATSSPWGQIVSIDALASTLFYRLFGDPPPTDLPLGAAVGGLFVICALCTAVLHRRVRAHRVVR
jgi:ABC-2 type transport system permease protein